MTGMVRGSALRGLVDAHFVHEVMRPHKPRNLAKSMTVE